MTKKLEPSTINLKKAAPQRHSTTDVNNALQLVTSELYSLNKLNTVLKARNEALVAKCEAERKETVTSNKAIANMRSLCIATLGLLAIGYFYQVILSKIVGGILIFYCGGVIAVSTLKIAEAYTPLLKKLENLLER